MPPRYVYWTILIDNKPTAFRAREKEDLLPTLAQLRRTNAEVVLKWFARGRIWDSPEAEQEAQQRPPVTGDKRGRDWRPGGMHKDPRDRFRKKPGGPKGDRPLWQTSQKPPSFAPRGDKPQWKSDRPAKPPYGAPRGEGSPRRSPHAPAGGGGPQWQKSNRPLPAPPHGDRPQWEKSNKTGKPPYGAPRGEGSPRRSPHAPAGGGGPQGKSFSRPPGDRPQWQKSNRPLPAPPRGDRPWQNKTGKPPSGAPRGDGSPRRSPQGGGGPQWHKSGKPRGPAKPWQNKPRDGARPLPRKDQPPPKKRDDEE